MNIALLLSGGTGTRIGGDIPKQYITVDRHPIIWYALKTLMLHPGIDAIQVVASYEWHKEIQHCIDEIRKMPAASKAVFRGFSEPGQNRQMSIYNGLCDLQKYASEDAVVLIHDAARPCLSENLITECLEGIKGHEGVLPVLPMKDTVYLCEGNQIDSLLPRAQVFAGQAPEAFVLGRYMEANRNLADILQINGSTEPAILDGMDVVTVPGDETNFKVTTPADLERFRQYLAQTEFL